MGKQVYKTGFTPGNWEAEERKTQLDEELINLYVVDKEKEQDICLCLFKDKDGNEIDDEEWAENGRLIETAPFMFDSLHCFCIESSGGIGEMKCQRYEKGKKTGRCKYATEDDGEGLPCACPFWQALERIKGNDWYESDCFDTEEEEQ